MIINTTVIKARLHFTEDILGTAAADPEIHAKFIASKAPDAAKLEEEVASRGVDEVVRNETSVFARNAEGQPILWDYQIKGFFKDSCSMLSRCKGSGNESSKMKAFKKIIDGMIFVSPREIPIHFEGEIGNCQRPLRASTPMGERVALANSESIPAGAYIDIEVQCLDPSNLDAVKEWLDYGRLRGLGQWRNSGKGTFTWELIE